MRGIFWGDKGEGSIQNVKTYVIEVPKKTAGLYQVPKLRLNLRLKNLFYLLGGGAGGGCHCVWGNILGQCCGKWSKCS